MGLLLGFDSSFSQSDVISRTYKSTFVGSQEGDGTYGSIEGVKARKTRDALDLAHFDT